MKDAIIQGYHLIKYLLNSGYNAILLRRQIENKGCLWS